MIHTLLLLAAAAPRILSADFCADQLVLALADREQIAGLSPDAEKDFSHLRERAGGLPQARADAEGAIATDADVVLRFWGGDRPRLERLGIGVETLDYAADFDAVKRNVMRAAKAMGQPERGAALNGQIDSRLRALASRGHTGVTALYVTPGGVTAGRETMIDAIMTAAGVTNAAAQAGLSYWPPLSAEAVITNPPQFIVAGFFASASERINHWSAARHPAIRRVLFETPGVAPSEDVLSCPGPQSVDAAEAIRDAVDASTRSPAAAAR